MPRNFYSVALDRVQKAGLLPALRRTRSFIKRDIARWIRSGCPSPAPPVVKMEIVNSYVKRTGAKVFVETGTLVGGTIEFVARRNRHTQCYSIEIDERYFQRARSVLGWLRNVQFLLGDSSRVIPELLADLDSPAVFWLDGHYSGPGTGKGGPDTPVSAELEAILGHSIKGHTILIDDAKLFDGKSDYPALSSILAAIDEDPDYQAEVSADIIRITPVPA